jgi:hypothetical protein
MNKYTNGIGWNYGWRASLNHEYSIFLTIHTPMSFVLAVFLLSVFLIFYTYIGFPFILYLLSRKKIPARPPAGIMRNGSSRRN